MTELTVSQALQQGISAHKEGNLQEAERLYRSILSVQPQHPDANHNLGVVAVAVGKVEAALPLFKTALEINPEIEQFWFSYMDALVRLNCRDEAQKLLEQAKEAGLQKDNIVKLKALLRNGDTLSQPVAGNTAPTSEQLNNLIALYSHGNFQEALKLGNQLATHFPSNQIIPNILGAVLADLGKYNEAISNYRTSIRLSPRYAEAHYNLGTALRKIGEYGEAVTSFEEAIKLMLNNAEVYNELGSTLKELGRYEEAVDSFKKAIGLTPNHAETHNNLGTVLQELGRLEDAVSSYVKAIELRPNYAIANNNLGNALSLSGKYDEAIKSFKKTAKLEPESHIPRVRLCEILQSRGKFSDAIDFLVINLKR